MVNIFNLVVLDGKGDKEDTRDMEDTREKGEKNYCLYHFTKIMIQIRPPCSPPLVRGDADRRGVKIYQAFVNWYYTYEEDVLSQPVFIKISSAFNLLLLTWFPHNVPWDSYVNT
ncbi:hypothetical protein AMR41_15350 [Hapalosiphon sp. MRB220]|nr:hypothetical protein AMR41_15350 [Hapalosiphon sp. MRB220]